MKKFLFLIFTFALLLPSSALATLDLRCYPKTDCIEHHVTKATAQGVAPPEESSMYRSAVGHPDVIAACGGSKTIFKSDGTRDAVVFCNPYGRAQTQISIGSESDFTDIADYFQYLYRYSIGVAGLLAVIMIIVAGFQWITSGGNTSTIGKARTRITRAIIGLLLVVGAYTILNTINPALVNLRLPQNWVLRPIGIAPLWCDAIQGEAVRFAEVPAEGDPADPSLTVEQTDCGKSYYSNISGDQTCEGKQCDSSGPQTCMQKIGSLTPTCERGNIVGNVYSSSPLTDFIESGTVTRAVDTIFGEGWSWPWLEGLLFFENFGGQALYAVCNTGEVGIIHTINNLPNSDEFKDENTYSQFYTMETSPSDLDTGTVFCDDNRRGLKGYLLGFHLNETGDSTSEEHFAGRVGNLATDLGNESMDENQRDCLLRLVPDSYFLQKDEIIAGINLDLDVYRFADIDDSTEEEDLEQIFSPFGFTWDGCNLEEPGFEETVSDARRLENGCVAGNWENCLTLVNSCESLGGEDYCETFNTPSQHLSSYSGLLHNVVSVLYQFCRRSTAGGLTSAQRTPICQALDKGCDDYDWEDFYGPDNDDTTACGYAEYCTDNPDSCLN
ncbi:pilin [Patescibacteria group bacterium]|nr:pilin [Patescibacteria group bacterium]